LPGAARHAPPGPGPAAPAHARAPAQGASARPTIQPNPITMHCQAQLQQLLRARPLRAPADALTRPPPSSRQRHAAPAAARRPWPALGWWLSLAALQLERRFAHASPGPTGHQALRACNGVESPRRNDAVGAGGAAALRRAGRRREPGGGARAWLTAHASSRRPSVASTPARRRPSRSARLACPAALAACAPPARRVAQGAPVRASAPRLSRRSRPTVHDAPLTAGATAALPI